MQLKLTINLDNAAFGDEAGTEVARILRELADDLDGHNCVIGERHVIFDANGNRVGEAKVTK